MRLRMWLLLRKSRESRKRRFKFHHICYIFILIFFGGVGFFRPSDQIDLAKHLIDIEIELLKYRRVALMENEKSVGSELIVGIMPTNHLSSEQIEQLSSLIYDLSKMYENLSVELICATIKQESGWHSDAISAKGAIGLMQIMPSTGAWLAKLEGLPSFAIRDLFDPLINIRLGCRYLSMLIDQYQDISLALAHYNGGSNQAKFLALGDSSSICEETKKYVPAVLAQMQLNREYFNFDIYNK